MYCPIRAAVNRQDKNYVSSLLAKLGLERRTQAAVLAAKLLGEKR